MEQLINKISEETTLSREESLNLIKFLVFQMKCSLEEIQLVYEKNGIEGLQVYEMTYAFKQAELADKLHILMKDIKEETRLGKIATKIRNWLFRRE